MRTAAILILLCCSVASSQTTQTGQVFAQPFFRSAVVTSRPSASEVVPNLAASPDAKQVELIVRDAPDESWRAQVKGLSVADVRKGDVLLVTLDLRSRAVDPLTLASAVQLVIQKSEPPFTVYDQSIALATPERQTTRIPLRVGEDLPAGKLQLAINFGVCRQRVELSNVEATNLGPRQRVSDLRSPGISYDGRAPDAPWRKAAADRIEQLRKSGLQVRVIDKDGRPISGAIVKIEQLDHAFAFGTAVTADRILGQSEDDQKYRQVLKGNFNTVVFENDVKWPTWSRGRPEEQRAQRQRTLDATKWLRDNNFRIRGHNMIWPGWDGPHRLMPDEVRRLALAGDIPAVRGLLAARINDIAGTFAGRFEDWDVVNEPLHEHELLDILGRGAMIEWFGQARRVDPAAKLYLNEYVFLSYGALNGSSIQRLYDEIKVLLQRGTLIDGIGEQAHFDDVLVSPPRMIALLDRIHELGLPIRITEFDVNTDDEQLQGDYTRDFVTAAFSHPAVNGVIMWGFWQGQIWQPQAALWRKDWSKKPNAVAWERLVNREWRTNVELTTDSNGAAKVRGFLGRYRVAHGAQSREAQLDADGIVVTLQAK